MKYYLIYDTVLMRGDDDDVTTFEVFENGEWKEDFELGWQVLYDSMPNYKQISQSEASALMA